MVLQVLGIESATERVCGRVVVQELGSGGGTSELASSTSEVAFAVGKARAKRSLLAGVSFALRPHHLQLSKL
jgi:hypothetical protein